MTSFANLGLIEPLLRAVTTQGYTTPTPIQAQAIPTLLDGRDVLGIAQTGTGKTAAFALPILQHLATTQRRGTARAARVLILTPTRELACQISDDFRLYGKHLSLRHTVIHGGISQNPQVNALRNGVETIIATPGRLLDLVKQRHADLSGIEIFVLDEADRMLDMGFINDVRTIVARLPSARQTLMFSATLPLGVTSLVNTLLKNHARIEVTPQATTVERIDQKVMFVTRENKRRLLEHILRDRAVTRAIVFSRTKHGADRVADQLQKAGVQVVAIHGNKSQNARQRALDSFKAGGVRVLVATDIAARGIDVEDVSHVINFDLPMEPEGYVHRIGRTARASAAGTAVSFCDIDEVALLRAIEREIRRKVPIETDHPYHAAGIAADSSAGRFANQPQRAPKSRHGRQGQRRGAKRDARPSSARPTAALSA